MGPLDCRLTQLQHSIESSKYGRQKSALVNELKIFLENTTEKTLSTAGPRDIARFLVWKDKGGKTVVHSIPCPYLGSTAEACGCPKRLAAGTVDSLIGKLKSCFRVMGRGDSWDEGKGQGNPASSLCIKQYLKAISEQQARAHVPIKKAPPLFIDKLRQVVRYIIGKQNSPNLSLRDKYVLSRDRAYFLVLFFAGDRPGDLGLTLIQEMWRFPQDEGVLFNHTYGKTLRGGSQNMFGIWRCSDSAICPVKAVEEYMETAVSMRVDMDAGYLFRPVEGALRVIDTPFSSGAAYDRLKGYLRVLGIDQGETAHSARSGCAISMALGTNTQSFSEIMQHVGWASQDTANHYMRLKSVLNPQGISATLAHSACEGGENPFGIQNLTAEFRELNNLTSFTKGLM